MDIVLSQEELGWWNAISGFFAQQAVMGGSSDRFLTDQIGVQQRKLMKSLIERNAIPARRFKWLTDPNFTIGDAKSRLEIIQENSRLRDESIFELPVWGLRFLPFLLGKIDLPQSIIDAFRSDAADRLNNGYELGMKYRGIAKQHGLRKQQAEEFHKLSLDCDLNHSACRTIRDIIFKYLK